MAKAKRVTVRLDDELDAIINQACVDGNCDKTAVVLSALKKGLAVDADEPDEGQTDLKTPVSKPIPKASRLVVIEDDGTVHELEHGKVVSCHKPGEPKTYLVNR